jgi:hypothetical protein
MSKAKRQPRQQRICSVCERVWTQPEHGWDVHLIGDAMIDTCSPGCRRKAGLPERRRV